MNYREMTDDQLAEAIAAWSEQYGDLVSQHRAECAHYGDSWPGACLQIDSLATKLNAAEAELKRRRNA